MELVKLLLKWDPKVETEDLYKQTPLFLASENGHAEIVQLLLDQSAQLEKQDRFKQTPLSLAAERGCSEVVDLLLKHIPKKQGWKLDWILNAGREDVVLKALDLWPIEA